VTTAGRALAALRGELAGRGLRADAMMLARWHGQLSPAGGPAVGYAAGLFWWPAGRVSRDGFYRFTLLMTLVIGPSRAA
jgi:hypothetical protein